jgi:hypothetical protein
MCTDKGAISYLYPAVKIGTRILGPDDSHSTVMSYKVHIVADGHMITDTNQIRLTSKRKQVCAEDLNAIANLHALLAEISNRISTKSRGTKSYGQRPANHDFSSLKLSQRRRTYT